MQRPLDWLAGQTVGVAPMIYRSTVADLDRVVQERLGMSDYGNLNC